MKRLLIGLVAVWIAMNILSCRQDLGNYDYSIGDTLTIEGIEDQYSITAGEIMNIVPKFGLNNSKEFNSENYSFEWISFQSSLPTDEQRKDFYQGQNLDIQFPFGLGSYDIYYKVTEKSSGISWQKKFKIVVEGSYSGGWAVLSEIDNQSRLDFFEYDHATVSYPKVYRDFTKQFIDAETGKSMFMDEKPKFIEGWTTRTGATGTAYTYFLYIGRGNSLDKLNLTDGFVYSERYNFKFETAGGAALSYVDKIIPYSSTHGYAYKDGDLFYRYIQYQMNFGTPVNRLSDGSYFKVAPYFAVGIASTVPSMASILMYDQTNRRFVRHTNYASISVSPLPYTEEVSAFNPNAVDMDLVWMGQTKAYSGRAYAVLKSDDQKYFLARMDNSTSFAAIYYDDISSLPDVANATHFAVDQLYGYLHYAVGGKLYQYDVDSKNTKVRKVCTKVGSLFWMDLPRPHFIGEGRPPKQSGKGCLESITIVQKLFCMITKSLWFCPGPMPWTT